MSDPHLLKGPRLPFHIHHGRLQSSFASWSPDPIRKFIPKFHHKQLYHSIFLPHLIYGITLWGGACPSKLEKVFSLQKRCIRILFGNKVSFDHVEFYETCARARPLTSINTHEINYELENTKPALFNNNNLLTVHNLYSL